MNIDSTVYPDQRFTVGALKHEKQTAADGAFAPERSSVYTRLIKGRLTSAPPLTAPLSGVHTLRRPVYAPPAAHAEPLSNNHRTVLRDSEDCGLF